MAFEPISHELETFLYSPGPIQSVAGYSAVKPFTLF